MAKTAFKGTPVTLAGEFVKVGTPAPEFTLVKGDLSNYTLKDGKGKYLVLNIFPSMDTGVCDTSVRNFNHLTANILNVTDLFISKEYSNNWHPTSRMCRYWPSQKICLSHRDASVPQKASPTSFPCPTTDILPISHKNTAY